MYTSQGKATKKFGITFRSKLEAMYAYDFDKQNSVWEYSDYDYYDFIVDELQVEIKPKGLKFLEKALNKAFDNIDTWKAIRGEQKFFCIMCGEPDDNNVFVLSLYDCNCHLKVDLLESNKISISFVWGKDGFKSFFCPECNVWHDFETFSHDKNAETFFNEIFLDN